MIHSILPWGPSPKASQSPSPQGLHWQQLFPQRGLPARHGSPWVTSSYLGSGTWWMSYSFKKNPLQHVLASPRQPPALQVCLSAWCCYSTSRKPCTTQPGPVWEDTALGPTETEHGAVLCRPQKVPLHLPVQLFQPKSHLQIACGSNLYLLTA